MASFRDVKTETVLIASRWTILLFVKIDHETNLIVIAERPCEVITIVDYGRACYVLACLRAPDLTVHSTFLSTRADIDILLVDLDS